MEFFRQKTLVSREESTQVASTRMDYRGLMLVDIRNVALDNLATRGQAANMCNFPASHSALTDPTG